MPLYRLKTFALRTCTRCGAPEGERITRKIKDLEVWTQDIDLHFEHSDVWRRPGKVVIHQNGLCAFCDHPFRGKDHPLAKHEEPHA